MKNSCGLLELYVVILNRCRSLVKYFYLGSNASHAATTNKFSSNAKISYLFIFQSKFCCQYNNIDIHVYVHNQVHFIPSTLCSEQNIGAQLGNPNTATALHAGNSQMGGCFALICA